MSLTSPPVSQAINVAASSFWKGLLPYTHLVCFLQAALPVIAMFSGAVYSMNESINIVSAADAVTWPRLGTVGL